MHISWFDLMLLVMAFGFVWGGFRTGLIQAVGGVVGVFLGVVIASRYYGSFGHALAPVFGGSDIGGQFTAFFILFLFVTRLTGVAFMLVNKVFHMIAIVPGMKLVNRLGGAAFGLIEASLFIGLTLQFVVRLPITSNFAATIDNSAVASYFLGVAGWLVPLFPKVLKQAQDATKAINNVLPENVNASSVGNTVNAIKNTGLVK
jgi:membrane protein required for colicin V production